MDHVKHYIFTRFKIAKIKVQNICMQICNYEKKHSARKTKRPSCCHMAATIAYREDIIMISLSNYLFNYLLTKI